MFSSSIGMRLCESRMRRTHSSWSIPFSFHISRTWLPLRLKKALASRSTPSPASKPAMTRVSPLLNGWRLSGKSLSLMMAAAPRSVLMMPRISWLYISSVFISERISSSSSSVMCGLSREVALIIDQSHFGSLMVIFHKLPCLGVVAPTIRVGHPALRMQGPQVVRIDAGARNCSSRIIRATLEYPRTLSIA